MSTYASAAIWSGITHIGVTSSMLLRNIIFARFLDPTDFATALTFGLVLSIFEYISNFGHENLMQRSSSGNHPNFQATMHSTIILRGTIVALFILLISQFIPSLLNLPSNEFNYAWLALIPFVCGFAHLDHQRLHRKQDYSLTAKVSLTADISSVGIAVVCLFIWDSYWAFYVSSLFRHITSTALSHVWAKRNYTLAFNPQHIKALITFGLPLILVGILKAIGMEFDKAIVARTTGLEIFATYVLTLMLVMNGTNIVTVALFKIFIRRVSVAGNRVAETVKSNGIMHCYLVLPLLIILGVFGEDINSLIFGQQYVKVPFLIIAICAVVGMRSINQWLNQSVIGSAPTKLMLYADIAKVCAALIGVSLVYSNNDVVKIAGAFWLAEFMYFITLTLLLHKRFSIASASILVLSIYMVCIVVLQQIYVTSQDSLLLKISFTLATLSLFYGAFLTISKTCRIQTLQLIRSLSTRIGFQ